jgi:hypothetical protein
MSSADKSSLRFEILALVLVFYNKFSLLQKIQNCTNNKQVVYQFFSNNILCNYFKYLKNFLKNFLFSIGYLYGYSCVLFFAVCKFFHIQKIEDREQRIEDRGQGPE